MLARSDGSSNGASVSSNSASLAGIMCPSAHEARGMKHGARLFLDRHIHQIAPLGPAPIVVADAGEAQEVPEGEPRVAAALADAAIGDDLLRRVEAVILDVELAQFLRGPEGAVLRVDGAGPGDAARTGNVSAAEGALVGVVGHVQALTRELLGTPHVDELVLRLHVREDLLAEGAVRRVLPLGRPVGRGGPGRGPRPGRPARPLPPLPP